MNPAFRKIHDEICAWLRANGIEPGNVWINHVPTVADGKITCPVYLRDSAGRQYVDGTGELASGVVTVPLVERPPAALARWLAGKVRP